MIRLTEYVKPNENEITDPSERFFVKLNEFKSSSGLWYTLFGQRIVPFLLYIIPMNVIIKRFNQHILTALFPGVNFMGPLMTAMWIVAMLVLLAFLIFLPKVATPLEFALGFAYLFLAFRLHLFNTLLGYGVLIGMIIFLIVKLVFLVFEIKRLRAFADDKKNNIERDESGRIVRAVEENVYLSTGNDELTGPVPGADNEVYFAKENDDDIHPLVSADDEVVFSNQIDDAESNSAANIDNDFFFG